MMTDAERQDSFDRAFRRGKYAPSRWETLADVAKGLLGFAGVYAAIFGGLFALAHVLNHMDIQSVVVLGLVGVLFGAYYLGFHGPK